MQLCVHTTAPILATKEENTAVFGEDPSSTHPADAALHVGHERLPFKHSWYTVLVRGLQ